MAQGCAAIFDRAKRLKMKETGKRIFLFLCSDKTKDGFYQSFTKTGYLGFVLASSPCIGRGISSGES